MTSPPVGFNGEPTGATTSWPGVSAALPASSANVRPLGVDWPPFATPEGGWTLDKQDRLQCLQASGEKRAPEIVAMRFGPLRYRQIERPREMLGDTLLRVGQYERNAAKKRAKINLQAAIAADVVKSPPHGGAVRGTWRLQRRREARKIVHNHFRNSGRA